MKQDKSKSGVQGEGDYASAEKYNQKARSFAESGKVEQAAKNAAPRDQREADEMRKAEDEGRSHSRGKDEINVGGEPGNKNPEKRAPGKNPQSKPIPEKAPGKGKGPGR